MPIFNLKYLILFILFTMSCGTTKSPFVSTPYEEAINTQLDEENLLHTLYLIGDTGDTKMDNQHILDALQEELKQESASSSIVFLGDNIYPSGMPSKSDKHRKQAESIISRQLDILTDHSGQAYFIAGERDWRKGDRNGRKALRRQEAFVESYFDINNKVKMYPGKACGDPNEIKVADDLIFLFVNTQWWLQDWSKEKNINESCDIKSRYDLLSTIKEILTDRKNDHVVLFMHHPIQSNGIHGGNFPVSDHIFPFRNNHGVSLPLPIIGSLVPIFRNITGTKQDIANAHNQALMQEIRTIATNLRMKVTFASAHDNSLQYFDDDKLQYIISGSGSRVGHTVSGGEADFVFQRKGYMKLNFYKEFETWLEVYASTDDNKNVELVYEKMIRAPRPGTIESKIKYPALTDTEIKLPANKDFAAGGIKKLFLGSQYRDMWATDVTAPIIDLEKKYGGLRPIKKGGGMASNSLRMEKENGQQYILRSINKDYRKLVPTEFENLKLINILKDQNSASHPYGALIIPALSRAAGIYYTEPELVYLQHQQGLGNYNEQFPEELYLLEERPDGDWSNADQFGNSSEIIGYTDLLEKLREKKTHYVDQKWVLKSRLFDLWIHDWDRHDDQWRWASFENDDLTIYRPIPRDRDQAFYKFVGIIPSYVATFVIKKFKTMKHNVKDVKNLAFNAKHFDRYFLHELEWEEWETIITNLQADLDDKKIDSAMANMPVEVQHLNVSELTEKLKSRRDNLRSIGKRLYDFLSQEVEIPGSNDDNDFYIEKYKDGSLEIKWYVEKDKKNLLKYRRTFYPDQTSEVRLYGMRGKDRFYISGSNQDMIKLRIIGGEDKDQLVNLSDDSKVYVYDNLEGIEIDGEGIIDRRSTDLEVNAYDRQSFTYDSSFPLLSLGYTQDDRFWFGGSYSWTKQGWRKDPYKSKHSLSATFAPFSNNAFITSYDGHFPNVVGSLGFAPSVELNFPYYENFFGLGNNSINTLREIQYNWVRMQNYSLKPYLQYDSQNENTKINFGPSYQSFDVDNTEGRVSEDTQLGFSELELKRRHYLGIGSTIETQYMDNKISPKNGFRLGIGFEYLKNVSQEEDIFSYNAELQFYIKLINKPELVLANSVGYEQLFGNPQFFLYPDLGNNNHLRGYRNNRFRGDAAFHHNIDLRFHLLDWDNNIIPMEIGVIAGYDYGRVWLDKEISDKWHTSRTVGIWFNLIGSILLQPYYSFTEEQNIFSLSLGFSF